MVSYVPPPVSPFDRVIGKPGFYGALEVSPTLVAKGLQCGLRKDARFPAIAATFRQCSREAEFRLGGENRIGVRLLEDA